MTITREQAVKLHDSGFWKELSARQKVEFQLFEQRLCMPFSEFHKAMEEVLGRPVWTHEFASDNLKAEFLGERPAPSMDDIINLIPADKRIILTL